MQAFINRRHWINLPRDDEQTFLWPVVLLCYFTVQGSWEAPTTSQATLSLPEASKHLHTTRTLQQHMATAIDPQPSTQWQLWMLPEIWFCCFTSSIHRCVLAAYGNQHWPETSGKFLCHLQPAISHGSYTRFEESISTLARNLLLVSNSYCSLFLSLGTVAILLHLIIQDTLESSCMPFRTWFSSPNNSLY